MVCIDTIVYYYSPEPLSEKAEALLTREERTAISNFGAPLVTADVDLARLRKTCTSKRSTNQQPLFQIGSNCATIL